MKSEQHQQPEKIVRGQYFKPRAQDNPFSGFREQLLQSIVQLYPEVLESLRQDVLEPYRRLGPHVAFHYAKSLPRRKIESVEAFRDSIPKFAFSMALGYAPQGQSVSFRFRAITEFLATYPNPDELNEFWQFSYEDLHTMETQLSGLSGTARQRLYEWFEAEWDARMPDETVAVFADEAYHRLQTMWHALDEWALRFNLAEEWILENVRETLFTGAFTSNSEVFPHHPRWDFAPRTWVMPDWATQDFKKPAEVSIPFDYEPVAETREAYRDRAHKRFEEALKVALADLEAQLKEAGYREAPKIKVRPHHLDWLAITLVTRCSAEQLLTKWLPPDGIEIPNVSSVRRTLESVSDIVGVQLPKSRGR